MPFLFQYLIKFSISLAILYTFYFLVLRPLTFYQWNRFYLLCYSLLSFIIPFINVTPWIPVTDIQEGYIISSIPVVEKITTHSFSSVFDAQNILSALLSWNFVGLFFMSGALVMMSRIIYQYLSLRAIKNKAVLLKTGEFEFYDVDGPISPFSFANAIFINSRLHTEDEFHKILEHEFVHVKQKHTIDIVVAELICVLNWFNPFAWMIRKTIRQNLEFIADNNVLEGGIDARQYQYLLLKVMGLPQYSIANNFSFSSLKKRIAMMNKIKSAKVHLVKFLFILPLLAVMLLAFRDKMHFTDDNTTLTFAGIVMNMENYEPIQGIVIKDLNTNTETLSDDKGFFKIQVPVKNDTGGLKLEFYKSGFFKKKLIVGWTKFEPKGSQSILSFVGIDNSLAESTSCTKCFTHQQVVKDENHLNVKDISYETALAKFDSFIDGKKVMETIVSSSAPIMKMKDQVYIISGRIPDSGPNVKGDAFSLMSWAAPNPVIYLNGKPTTMENVNATVSRVEIKSSSILNEEKSLKKYGKAINVVDLKTYSGIGSDTVPLMKPRALIRTNGGNTRAVRADSAVPPAARPAKIATSVPVARPSKLTTAAPQQPAKPAKIGQKIAIRNAGTNTAAVSGIVIRHGDKLNNDEPLYIVDQKIQPKGIGIDNIPGESIAEINVLKGENATALYGNKGKNGVIDVRTKDEYAKKNMPGLPDGIVTPQTPSNFKARIFVDGIESTNEKLARMDPASIESVSVFKNKPSDFYIEKNSPIENMLKKLPGIEVDSSGKVSVQGQDVQKVLVDGVIFVTKKPS